MSHVGNKLTRVLAGMAVASLPVLVGAQSTTSSPQTSQQTPRQTTDKNSPQHHLNEAKRVLAGITSNSTQVAELRRHFLQLEIAWNVKMANAARMGASGATHAGGHVSSTGGTTSGTPSATTAGTTGTPEQAGATGTPTDRQAPRSAGADTWITPYQAIDAILDQVLGDTTAGVTAGTTGSTTATGVGVSANVNIDAATRTKLTEFRRHIDQFHTTAMAQSRIGEEDAASASPSSGITGSMTETTASTASTTPMPPTTTASTTGVTGTTGTTGSVRGSATASASPDQAAIARLTAQIDEWLRGSTAASTPGAATSTTTGTGTPTTGTVCIDRAKLEQLKRDLQALRK